MRRRDDTRPDLLKKVMISSSVALSANAATKIAVPSLGTLSSLASELPAGADEPGADEESPAAEAEVPSAGLAFLFDDPFICTVTGLPRRRNPVLRQAF